MAIIEKTWFSNNPPTSTNIMWAKPVEPYGFVFYLFNRGRWEPQRMMDGKGTNTISDDEVMDLKPIDPADLEEITRVEIQRQLENYEDDDVNTRPSGDDSDYPLVDVI